MFNCTNKPPDTLLFVGSYTEGKPANGISVYQFNSEDGSVALMHTVDSLINPSFLSLSPDNQFLYSVTESQLQKNGSVSSFKIDAVSGSLKFLNSQDCGGRNPVHLNVHPSGRFIINSNYTDPGISVFEVGQNGYLNPYSLLLKFKDSSIIEGRQDQAHIHSTNFSPDGKFLFAQDLGADKIRGYILKITDSIYLSPMNAPEIRATPGSGPRHFTFHPNGKYGYGISELSGEVVAYLYNDGQMNLLEEYGSYSKKQEIHSAADIHISPDGRFLYATNRGPEEDSVAIFSINMADGRLSLVGHEPTHGEHPRNFAIDPSGNFLLVANQFSNKVVIFRRDIQNGTLTKLKNEIPVNRPSSLQMMKIKY